MVIAQMYINLIRFGWCVHVEMLVWMVTRAKLCIDPCLVRTRIPGETASEAEKASLSAINSSWPAHPSPKQWKNSSRCVGWKAGAAAAAPEALPRPSGVGLQKGTDSSKLDEFKRQGPRPVVASPFLEAVHSHIAPED
jgi:hypothetical protein